MSILLDLALKYNTDKVEHGYIPFYEQHLPQTPVKMLEIGVKENASIQMWSEYFPNTIIHGLDLFQEFPQPPDTDRIKYWKGNQVDYYLLEQLLREDYDIIIDDGSHMSRHQMMTFFALYTGKHYFIEDIHCCREEFYRDKLPYNMTADGLFDSLRFPHGFQNTIRDENSRIVLIKDSIQHNKQI